ncbi:MAG: hypothetical protein ACREBT_07735 [Thermoplasmata archaeon]
MPHDYGHEERVRVGMPQRPELRTIPMTVVTHHLIARANHAARGRGARGGPRAEVEEASEALFDALGSLAGAVEPRSMERAFLDAGTVSWPDAVAIGHELRRRASAEFELHVSIGVRSTELVAKLASKAAKPDGIRVIDHVEEPVLRERSHSLLSPTPPFRCPSAHPDATSDP